MLKLTMSPWTYDVARGAMVSVAVPMVKAAVALYMVKVVSFATIVYAPSAKAGTVKVAFSAPLPLVTKATNGAFGAATSNALYVELVR